MSFHSVNSRVNLHSSLAGHFRETLTIAWPVILSQLSHTLVGVADTVFVGQTGNPTALATISFANNLYVVPLVGCLGVSMGLTAVVSNLSGKGSSLEDLADCFWASLLLNVVVAGVVVLAFPVFFPYLEFLKPSEEVLRLARPVLFNFIVSLLPLAVFQTCKQWLEGMGQTFYAMAISVGANVVNIILNYVFVYGKLGFMPMGAQGSSLATLLARILMALAIVWYLLSQKPFREVLIERIHISVSRVREVWGLGFPISLQMLFEVAAFAGAALLMGKFGEVSIASHQVAISLASLTYMAASGLAAAATVRVGFFFGSRQPAQLSMAANASLVSALVFMGFTSILMAVLNQTLPALYSPNFQIQKLAAYLLLFAAFFQLADGVQVVCLGILRGMTDVKIPTIVTLLSYWAIAIPLAVVAGFLLGFKETGIWVGLNVGLYLAAILLYFRYLKLFTRVNKSTSY